jgi:hypothetical protein
MSFIRRTIGGWSESLSLGALAGEVYAPDDTGAGPPDRGDKEGAGSKRPARGRRRPTRARAKPEEEVEAQANPPEEGAGTPTSEEGAGPPPPAEGGGPAPRAINVAGLGGGVFRGGLSGSELGGLSGAVSVGLAGGARTNPGSEIPAAIAQPSTVFVEVGAAAEQAAISRNGVQVPIVQINPATLQTALGNTITLPARVVSQSIAPGVSVAKGTSVDVTLTEPTKITVGVLQNPFQPITDWTLDTVYKSLIRDNPAVQSVLARNTSSATLNQVDQSTLTEALGTTFPVTTTAGQTIDAAFDTLQAAFTFGT